MDSHDAFHPAYARNLGRLLNGVTLTFGDPEIGQEEHTVTVERVGTITVGFDSAGIFASVEVVDTDGRRWRLYHDGIIETCEGDEREVGRHALTLEKLLAAQAVA